MLDDLTPGETNTIIAFDVMNVIGLLMTSLVLFPALLSRTVVRSSAWIALMTSSMFYSSSYLLLLPTGQRSVSQPAYGVCLFQGSLVYSAPVLVSFAGWAYVLQLYIGLFLFMPKLRLLRVNIMLLLSPVCIAGIMFVASLAFGIQYPETVVIDSTRRYCHITSHLPRIMAAVLIGVGTAGMMVFEVILIFLVSRRWRASKEMNGFNAWHKVGRVIIFTIIFPFGAFTLNIAGLYSSGTTNDKWNLLLPIIPIGTALIFGTRTDIFKAWKTCCSSDTAWNIYEEPKPISHSCPNCGKISNTV
ncbi:hypothetical protein EV361DRAFT_933284 [Lentinula raphanica]|nr:hypothetical protein EV361DRAFT_933284 [Lentinula raphanica]